MQVKCVSENAQLYTRGDFTTELLNYKTYIRQIPRSAPEYVKKRVSIHYTTGTRKM